MFHGTEYGAAVSSAPSVAPSRRNCTPTTPTLSAAVAVTVTVPLTVAPLAGDVRLTVGGVLSFDTVTVTAADVVTLPAASRATAVRLCDPLLAVVVVHGTEYGAAVSSAPSAAPSRRNCTPTTPTLSEALPFTATVPRTVDPGTGDAMLTLGGVVSLKTVTVTGWDVQRTPSNLAPRPSARGTHCLPSSCSKGSNTARTRLPRQD